MDKSLLHTPEGVRDIYGTEYERILLIQEKIRNCMAEFSYRPIKTPSFEFFDVYGKEVGTTPSKDLFKLVDKDGFTLVLRPDFTPSIARCAAKYFMNSNEPIRFRYEGNVFSNVSSFQGKLKEYIEMGAELIQDESIEADAEMIVLAIQSLKAAGLEQFQIKIGNNDYFLGLCEEANMDFESQQMLRELLSEKKYVEARCLLEEFHVEPSEALYKIADFFGDFTDLASIKSQTDNNKSIHAIERLEQLDIILKEKNVDTYVSYDLAMLSRYHYYTGILFKGYTYGSGDAILKGGRYDKLLKYFGKEAAAVGFKIIVDDLMESLEAKTLHVESEGDRYLTFALTKGRLASKTLGLLNKLGISCTEMEDKETRKLIFVNEDLKLRFFLAKGPDVPTYVEYGAADIGVVGRDTILEENRNGYEVLDLGFGACRMCVCGPLSSKTLLNNHERIRVATKYPNIAKEYFYNVKHQTVDLIKLNGSVELGPLVGLADVIVDIVETGSTLRENGLDVLEEICPLSARMIVNKVSMQMQQKRIMDLVVGLQDLL